MLKALSQHCIAGEQLSEITVEHHELILDFSEKGMNHTKGGSIAPSQEYQTGSESFLSVEFAESNRVVIEKRSSASSSRNSNPIQNEAGGGEQDAHGLKPRAEGNGDNKCVHAVKLCDTEDCP
jgi:hypothetical protein